MSKTMSKFSPKARSRALRLFLDHERQSYRLPLIHPKPYALELISDQP